MTRCLVALGANLGDREQTLGRAVELLAGERQISAVACSRLHETASVGGAAGQGPFLNGVLGLKTTLAPEQLHAMLRRIESHLGRKRTERWAARPIDLDLLLYGEQVIETPNLVVPHPRMAFRRFVLEPAVEVGADMVHPTIGRSIAQLLALLNTALPYVALLGLPGRGKTALGESLARQIGGIFLADPPSVSAMPERPNPPSHAYERAIQFLDRRSEVLDLNHWPAHDVPAVSDFYFDQSLAYAQIELDEADTEAFRRAWAEARPHVVQPKLLVVVDDRPPVVSAPPGRGQEQRAVDPPRADRLRRELLTLAARRGIGPVLYAGNLERQAQFDEISAAIAAMR
jgi:2-amino-4-hydroxy-6-hydroxymethyldihydropteridine diphosphokinase